jgi:predicted DNA-binding protein
VIVKRGDLDKKVSFCIPGEQYEAIKRMADRLDTTLSHAMRKVVNAGLSQMDNQRAA